MLILSILFDVFFIADNNNKFDCKMCGKKLSCQYSLKEHMNIHLKLLPHEYETFLNIFII